MFKKLSLIALVQALVSCQKESAYVFSYFSRSHQEAGLCLAYSYDGYHWSALNGNKPVLAPTVGKDRLKCT